jgi:thioredoxin-like negative regulator of GroEL
VGALRGPRASAARPRGRRAAGGDARARRPARRRARRHALRLARGPRPLARTSARCATPRVRRSAEDWQAKIAATAGGRALVVDFTAPWCKPCQKIYPFFKRLAATFDEAATFVKVDVDDLEDVAEAAKVTMMPTFQVYRDGALAGALSGANENNLRHFVETHCLGAKKEN